MRLPKPDIRSLALASVACIHLAAAFGIMLLGEPANLAHIPRTTPETDMLNVWTLESEEAACREEAEGLFASWDSSSEAATPRASETGHSPALTPTLAQSRMGSLSPGALDDSNFPTLALQASSTKVAHSPNYLCPLCA